MRLAPADEFNLLLPLYESARDSEYWQVFLSRLQRRTSADHAAFVLERGDPGQTDGATVFVGRNADRELGALDFSKLLQGERLSHSLIRPRRVYQMAELDELGSSPPEINHLLRSRLGATDTRLVRFTEQDGAAGWLFLIRNRGAFSAADGALMISLLPHIALAARNFLFVQRQALRQLAMSDALGRAGVGWALFGKDARMIDCDPAFAHASPGGFAESMPDPATLFATATARQALTEAAIAFELDAKAPPRVAMMSRSPPMHALLAIVPMALRANVLAPWVMAFWRFSADVPGQRPAALSHLFGLSPREAQLAHLMCTGLALGEAAAMMSLREGTARGYSKQIYAKMGVRGQAEMVRRVWMSEASLI